MIRILTRFWTALDRLTDRIERLACTVEEVDDLTREQCGLDAHGDLELVGPASDPLPPAPQLKPKQIKKAK